MFDGFVNFRAFFPECPRGNLCSFFMAQHKSDLVCPIHAYFARKVRNYSNDASEGTRWSCFVYDTWPIENSRGPMVVTVVLKNSKLSNTRGVESNRRRFFSVSASISPFPARHPSSTKFPISPSTSSSFLLMYSDGSPSNASMCSS